MVNFKVHEKTIEGLRRSQDTQHEMVPWLTSLRCLGSSI
jgi:hypothetical protein